MRSRISVALIELRGGLGRGRHLRPATEYSDGGDGVLEWIVCDWCLERLAGRGRIAGG
jgi:hypothetical protein